MASETTRDIANDPNFAVICAFLQKFGSDLGVDLPNFKQLQEWLTKTDEVSAPLRDLHIKLMRKTRKTVHEKSWESALSKFCFTYSAQDAWEIERFGYKNASVRVKLRILRELLEGQFERNSKFRAKILTQSADSLRSEPVGRDNLGCVYWLTQDNDCNLRIYQEHLDEEIWQVVATSRDEFVNLIERLRGNEVVLPSTDIGIIDEDTSSSNSVETMGQKVPPPEEQDDSQEDEQKVPKLSIKLINGRSPKDMEMKDVGKGEEELAAEEDARLRKKCEKDNESCDEEFEEVEDESDEDEEDERMRIKSVKGNESCDEEFEEVEEEYEAESEGEDARIENNDGSIFTDMKTVQPLFISQNKVKSNLTVSKCLTDTTRKRGLDSSNQATSTNPTQNLHNPIKKAKPSLLDSKRSKHTSKYDAEADGEEVYEDSAEDDDNIEEDVEEEDIDSAAAEEDENEEKLIEDFDEDDTGEGPVGNEISDPVIRVQGQGSGKECESGNNWSFGGCYFEDDHKFTIVSDAIEESIFFVHGEGFGMDCLVGNAKDSEKSPSDSNLNSTDACSKLSEAPKGMETKESGKNDILEKSPTKTTGVSETDVLSNSSESTGTHSLLPVRNEPVDVKQLDTKNIESSSRKKVQNIENVEKERKNDGDVMKISLDLKQAAESVEKELSDNKTNASSEEKNLDNALSARKDHPQDKGNSDAKQCNVHQAKARTVLELVKKELREAKLKTGDPSTSENNAIAPSNPTVWNRKRRLEDFALQQSLNTRHLHSESEIEINSENTEEVHNEQDVDVDERDVGGKRLKMRQRQNNSELRKKVEAKKAADHEETTSSSGGEESAQRRRKLISPKKHNDKPTFKAESESKSSHENPSTNNTNGQHKKCLLDKSSNEKSTNTTLTKQTPSTSTSLALAVKHKPTLAEIIEKKLKKTQNMDDKSSKSTTDGIIIKSPLSPPKKIPVTKPLKKNLLTQIRQESSEEAIQQKQPGSEVTTKETTIAILCNTTDSQKITPERHRKRHSSEEVDRNLIPEEPEAKKEVLCDDFKEQEKHRPITPADDPSKCQQLVDVKVCIKEEIKEEEPKSSAGRRSGRLGKLSVAYPEISQAKRTRGCLKKDESSLQPKLDVSKDDTPNNSNKEDSNTNTVQKVDEKEKKLENDSAKQKSENNLAAVPVSNESGAHTPTKANVKGTRKQRDVDTTNIIETTDAETPVRQSRRIAQQKIREEAERRKLEEIALRTMKQELKKKKKAEQQSDPTVLPPSEPSSESEESDIETKKKVQKKKCPGKNGSWSSGSEEQDEPDNEEYEEHHHYETDPGSPLFKSDHEFSPESDIEDETQVVPMKRARTVRKENAADEEREEEACQKCKKSDHPEWILLCDKCDKGYHCSCLSPVLFYIPEGDWYCPPCQQEQLIKALEGQLNEFDNMVERKKREQEEELRLAEEAKARQEEEDKKHKQTKKNKKELQHNKNGTSDGSNTEASDTDDANVSNSDGSDIENKKSSMRSKDTGFPKNKNNDKRNRRHNRRQKSARSTRARTHKANFETDSDSQKGSNSDSASKSGSSTSSSYSDSDNEPIYKLRKRRQINVSYRLNEYDDLINSALKKEMDDAAGAGNLGRGKDISTIIEADKEEKARQKQIEVGEGQEEETPRAETTLDEEKANSMTNNNASKEDETDSDDEPIKIISRPKPTLKKKQRKLTTLDISSEDDDGSDEDFKGSSIDDEEDTSVSGSSNSDSSLEMYKRKDKSKKKQRKAARRAFRERRKDRKFVVDESDDDEDVQRPKSKKKRKDDTDYTESEVDDEDLSDLSENIDSADLCDDTTTDESDGAWRPNKRKKSKKTSSSAIPKAPKAKPQYSNKPKKLEYSDDDISETEDEEDNDEDETAGVGGGKQPRSQPLKTTTNIAKTKAKAKGGSSLKTKKKKKSSEEEQSFSDSGDSTRRTRGRRYAYIEDFDDDSSDGGIKPGVQRPDTPPEEREKFIKRQEEIKRMLAEKNAEGAKLVATPRLTPIKSEGDKDKKSPSKVGGDSLSTVPLSVIRQAKVLDIDYLQRRGESLDDLTNDVGDVDDEFDDADLPDDLPEDMDEDAIARMVEDEEDFGAVAVREIPPPDEDLRTSCANAKPKPKDVERNVLPTPTTAFQTQPIQTTVTVSPSGLQEPVRKRLPMPTMHPPLLRHQLAIHDTLSSGHQMIQRHSAPQACHLLQNALSAPLTQSLPRTYPTPSHQTLLTRMAHSLQMQPSVSPILAPCRPTSPIVVKSAQQLNLQSQDKNSLQPTETEIKPRGRRKKITPLRDTLQKQQTAAAVAAAACASTSSASAAIAATAIIKAAEPVKSSPSSVIKGGPPSKGQQTHTNVVSNMHSTIPMQSISGRTLSTITSSAIYPGSEGFYGVPTARIPPPNTQRHRGPPQMSQSHLASHPAVRHSYGPPPPLKGAITLPPPGSQTNVRTSLHHLPPFVGGPPTSRQSGSHLNLYGASMYGNFGPRGNHRPPPIHSSEYPTGSRAYPAYGFYPPPPPLTAPLRAQSVLQQPPTSVIVSNVPSLPSTSSPVVNTPTTSVANSPESVISKSVMIKRELPIKGSPSKPSVPPPIKGNPEPRKKLTTLEAYPVRNTVVKSPPLPLTTHLARSQNSPGHRAANQVDDSPPTTTRDTTPPSSERQTANEGPASEFSGLVSYFSSQHDDYNT